MKVACTYTKKHFENGYSIHDISDFFRNMGLKHQISSVITTDETLAYNLVQNEDSLRHDILNTYTAIANKDFYCYINPYAHKLLLGLLLNIKSFDFCDELHSDYSLNYDYNGDVYNCFKLWGKNDFVLNHGETIKQKLKLYNKKDTIKNVAVVGLSTHVIFVVKKCFLVTILFPMNRILVKIEKTYSICLEELVKIVETPIMDRILDNFPYFVAGGQCYA